MASFEAEKGSRRPDGTYRKVIRIREGYVSPDEVKKYTAPMVLKAQAEKAQAQASALKRSGIPGFSPAAVNKKTGIVSGTRAAAPSNTTKNRVPSCTSAEIQVIEGRCLQDSAAAPVSPRKQLSGLENKMQGLSMMNETKAKGQMLNINQRAKPPKTDSSVAQPPACKVECAQSVAMTVPAPNESGTHVPAATDADVKNKKLKQLNKKLRQVMEIQAKIDSGDLNMESLNTDQREKLAKKAVIEEEIASLQV